MIFAREIDPKQLGEFLTYDPATGELRWKVDRRYRVVAGDIAGCVDRNGYRIIVVDRKQYKAHRVAWALHTGSDVPVGYQIDHINRERDDNRIDNLRLANQCENQQNTVARITSKSGAKGVIETNSGRYEAAIIGHGRRYFLGTFDTKCEASAAYRGAAVVLHAKFAMNEALAS